MSRRGSSNTGLPWGHMALAFLIPLLGLVLLQMAGDRAPEEAPYLSAATLAGFVVYAVVLGLRFFL